MVSFENSDSQYVDAESIWRLNHKEINILRDNLMIFHRVMGSVKFQIYNHLAVAATEITGSIISGISNCTSQQFVSQAAEPQIDKFTLKT